RSRPARTGRRRNCTLPARARGVPCGDTRGHTDNGDVSARPPRSGAERARGEQRSRDTARATAVVRGPGLMLRRAVPAALAMAALLRTAASAEATEVAHAASSLLGCLEPIARMFHVRIIDTTGRAPSIACSSTPRDRELESPLDHVLKPNGLDWRRREDGRIEIVAPAAASLKLPALDIDGDPVPDVARPDHPLATPLVERATAVTSLDRRWLDTAPLLGFNQISWYAPN